MVNNILRRKLDADETKIINNIMPEDPAFIAPAINYPATADNVFGERLSTFY